MPLKPFHNYSKKELAVLNSKIFKFYKDNTYGPFVKTTDHSSPGGLWRFIAQEIKKDYQKNKKKIKILEIGAAKTGFANYLIKNKIYNCVDFYTFDITKKNQAWYKKIKCKKSFFKNLNIKYKFDMVFSSYVLEHIVHPEKFLKKNINLIKKNGKIFIACPRYDLPFYLNPGCKHSSPLVKLNFAIKHIFYRFITIVFKKNFFLTHDDLAIFHKPYFVDANSMHWVSKFELINFFKERNFKTFSLNVNSKVLFSKDWFVKKFLTVAIMIKVTSDQGNRS